MSTIIVLNPPTHLDLQALAVSTRESLDLLNPWTRASHEFSDNVIVRGIKTQAAHYVDAIQLTVSAAYSGFSVTEDVIYLAEALQTAQDQEEVEHYVIGMLEMARESKENANAAISMFKKIQTGLYNLQQLVDQELSGSQQLRESMNTDELQGLRQELISEQGALTQIGQNIGQFALWWDWVKVETDPSRENQAVQYQLNALREPATLRKWRALRTTYASYVQMIGQIEDANICFFSRSWAIRPSISQELEETQSLLSLVNANNLLEEQLAMGLDSPSIYSTQSTPTKHLPPLPMERLSLDSDHFPIMVVDPSKFRRQPLSKSLSGWSLKDKMNRARARPVVNAMKRTGFKIRKIGAQMFGSEGGKCN